MNDTTDTPDARRRGLLFGLPLAGAAGAAALSGAPAEAAEAEPAPGDPRQVTFRQTDHVKTFYRLAREG